MKKRLPLLIAVLVVLGFPIFASCSKGKLAGSGNIIEEQREVSDFDEIHVSGMGNLVVDMGDEEHLRIKADDNLLPHINSQVKHHKLTIEIEKGYSLKPTESIYYYVTAKELERIAFAGSGSVEAGKLNAENFSLRLAGNIKGHIADLSSESLGIEISGSGDVKIDTLYSESLEVSINGSGKTSIENGQTEEQIINIAGSGKFEARNLENGRSDINVAGSGSACLRASDHLQINISGSGSVEYIGRPGVNSSIVGTGTVNWVEG